MRRSMASVSWSTMGTTSHGLARSSCESVSRLKLTRTSRLYSSHFIQNSDCSLVQRIPTGWLGGRPQPQMFDFRHKVSKTDDRRNIPVAFIMTIFGEEK